MAQTNGKSRFSLSASTGNTITGIWELVNPELVIKALEACNGAGVALSFAPTRSKSALSVCIVENGQRSVAYAEDAVSLESLLEAICIQAEL